MDKTVQVRDLVIGEGRPKICIPVIGSTTETLKEAAGHAMKKHPDLIEWRADEIADNTEASGDFPEISVDVSTSGGSDSSVGGTSVDMSE